MDLSGHQAESDDEDDDALYDAPRQAAAGASASTSKSK